jgi:phage-related protein
MPLKRIYLGASFEICYWCKTNEACFVEEFFKELQISDHPDLDQMLRLIKRVAEFGPPRNIEMSRALEDGLLEFKAGAIRIIWFYERNKIIICSHGFLKKGRKTPKLEIEKAQTIRKEYYAEIKQK